VATDARGAGVVKTASWPYYAAQCPECRYFQSFDPPVQEDDGYDVVGFCRHPRIGMELFELKARGRGNEPKCPCFVQDTPIRRPS
jgi:hypothetical protein